MSVNAMTQQAASPHQRKQTGFTLVELMIAIALGLIVVLAAVGFVVAVAKSNSENIQATRLTQELRSISEVVGREVRRARFVADPVGLIGSGGAVNRDDIYPQADGIPANCIVFSYDEPPTPPAAGVAVTRSVYFVPADGEIFLNPTVVPAGPLLSAVDCAGGSVLNTPQIVITNFQVTKTGSQVDIDITGRLAAPAGSSLASATRRFKKTVYVRSGRVN